MTSYSIPSDQIPVVDSTRTVLGFSLVTLDSFTNFLAGQSQPRSFHVKQTSKTITTL